MISARARALAVISEGSYAKENPVRFYVHRRFDARNGSIRCLQQQRIAVHV